MTIELKSGGNGVRITRDADGDFRSLFATNCRAGFEHATVLLAATHATESAARRWAAKKLAA